MAQLALEFPFQPRFGADEFLVAPSNAEAHALLMRWPDWPSRVLLLIGPEGAGKTHLATIWAAAASARRLEGADILPERLPDLTEAAFLLDDADQLDWSHVGLFHLLNHVQEEQRWLLLTAQRQPDHWALTLRDLVSRLRAAPLLRIAAPDEALLRAVLVKLFLDRQLMVDNGVVDFLALHLDRSLDAARALVDALDRASLASHRRITRVTAAQVLAEMS